MNIVTELYKISLDKLPKSGQHIIAHQTESAIVVYQAYNRQIADFAAKNQVLGGDHYSYNRMSWIKPNFLWMMYRCGWAEKENQERVLALWIKKEDFEGILANAVLSSFDQRYYENHDQWRSELTSKDVRLQWDPDHDPYGNKMERRAIQLGLKGNTLENFGKKKVQQIEDITDFVKQQKQVLDSGGLDQLLIPEETVFKITDIRLREKIVVDEIER